MSCKYRKDTGCPNTYECSISRFGERPSKAACRMCEEQGLNHPRGLGDEVARVAQPIKRAIQKVAPKAFKGCGCQERQNKLNEMFPKKDEANG